ncbi:MAG: deoxyribodipyrimidine photo-lyase [Desulfosalsimonas sp.]|uniref:deoxyribodipyrimidine photo-lyase n=1 Tax=Desulfosalsimonas sp. TaxID=3073848 RepID=UPI0039705CD9
MIHDKRITHFAGILPESGAYVLYWMEQAQRTRCNHALEFAAKRANELKKPLVVGFVLPPKLPGAGFRHYRFMLQGLAQVHQTLKKHGICFVMETADMVSGVCKLAEHASWVVTDSGYLRMQRQWRNQVQRRLACPFSIIETDVVVPVAAASDKQETAARTLRPRIMKNLDAFLDAADEPEIKAHGQCPLEPSLDIDPEKLCTELGYKKSLSDASVLFTGGQGRARDRLSVFIAEKLADYPDRARDPAAGCQSDLSPYLHFGQISPVDIVLQVRDADVAESARAAFIEQLVVRRELAVNFVWYNAGYDRYEKAVPAWAQKSLGAHRYDPRAYLYTPEQFEAAQTHDPYWNAAQAEMVATGKMHNYMRMYWGKKIIEWSETPESAFDTMLWLNNRYELDGRDPNGFAGVAWCFGRHDRGWKERDIFGKIRYMNAAGLERKFQIAEYVKKYLL